MARLLELPSSFGGDGEDSGVKGKMRCPGWPAVLLCLCPPERPASHPGLALAEVLPSAALLKEVKVPFLPLLKPEHLKNLGFVENTQTHTHTAH